MIGLIVRLTGVAIAIGAAVFLAFFLLQSENAPPAGRDGQADPPGISDEAVTHGGESQPDAAKSDEQTQTVNRAERLVQFERERAQNDPHGVDAALRRNYPVEHAALISAMFDAAEAGAAEIELRRRHTAFVTELIKRKIHFAPYASPKALRAYFEYNMRLIDVVRRKMGAQICAEVVAGGGSALVMRLRSTDLQDVDEIVALLARQTRAILAILRDGEASGARALAQPISADWRHLYRAMEQLGAQNTEIGQFQNGSLVDPEKICAVTRIYYAALLALGPEASARMHPFVSKQILVGK